MAVFERCLYWRDPLLAFMIMGGSVNGMILQVPGPGCKCYSTHFTCACPGSAVDVFFQVYCDEARDVWFLYRTRRMDLSTDSQIKNIFIDLWIGDWFSIFFEIWTHMIYLYDMHMCFNVYIYLKMLFLIRFVYSMRVGRERFEAGRIYNFQQQIFDWKTTITCCRRVYQVIEGLSSFTAIQVALHTCKLTFNRFSIWN